MSAATAIKTIVRWVLVTLGIAHALGLIGDANRAVPADPPRASIQRVFVPRPG